jgi:Zn-dependent M28 family amino/carboxypeptidase
MLGGLDLWGWAFVFAGICGVLQSAVIIQSLRADHGEFTPGANYNASGLGTILALAERLHGTPLPGTEVWIVCCGSHAAGGAGVRALLREYDSELRDAWLLGFEGVGIGNQLNYIKREGWLRRAVHPAMRELIDRAAQIHPNQLVTARSTARSTVVAPATGRGYKCICLALSDNGTLMPNAFNRADIADHLQPAAFAAAQEFGWRLLQQIDAAASR